jgi:Fe-S cluster biosynthesis and repair protein YggX
MFRIVFCEKLKESTTGLATIPFPGPLGEKIFEHVSEKAWKQWINHQTMLINEYRLSLIDPKSREFLQIEMEKYFFGEGSDKPAGFTQEKS